MLWRGSESESKETRPSLVIRFQSVPQSSEPQGSQDMELELGTRSKTAKLNEQKAIGIFQARGL